MFEEKSFRLSTAMARVGLDTHEFMVAESALPAQHRAATTVGASMAPPFGLKRCDRLRKDYEKMSKIESSSWAALRWSRWLVRQWLLPVSLERR